MFELLLYSNLSCAGAVDIIDRINAHDRMDAAIRTELIEVVQAWDERSVPRLTCVSLC